MILKRVVQIGVATWTILLLMPAVMFAQSIAGVVKDTSGAVLPGVTVEASSPALIEGARAVVTDSQGEYKIVSLSPGTYTVTLSLTGFSTVKREGIALTTGFTATVNGEMTVGGLAETITVVSEAPLVDTHTVRQTSIVSSEAIQALPTGRTSTGLAQLIPGISVVESGLKFQDVGGLSGEGNSFVIHGSRFNEGAWLVNGMPYSNLSRANSAIIRPDIGMVQEVALETSAISAEYREGGVAMNLVGKEGSNKFSGSFFAAYANDKMQASNFDDQLRASGVGAVNGLDKNYDWSAQVGGPLVQDRLWYFGNFRRWATVTRLAGIFDDSNRADFLYTPDLAKQSVDVEEVKSASARVTWQVTKKNKVQVYLQQQPRIGFTGVLALMPEAQTVRSNLGNGNIYDQVLWNSPVTSRLLFEAGASYLLERTNISPIDALVQNTGSPNWGYNIVDAGTGITYNFPGALGPNRAAMHGYKASMYYVTGSHALRVGLTVEKGEAGPTYALFPRDMTLQLINGAPSRITLQIQPRFTDAKLNWMNGYYVTDQWTQKRVTLNLGLRFDYNNASVPAQDQVAGTFIGPRHFDEVSNVPNWKDISPRIGVAYDLFGNGQTAVKASISRYVGGGNLVATANALNPVVTTVNSANRNWTDLNNDFIPQCDFLNPVTNQECGPLGNLNFGKSVVTTHWDPAITQGWNVRPYNWEATASIQHQLVPRVGVIAGYYHRWYGNFTVTDNLDVAPTDFSPYCITTPVDLRLPGGGGQPICGYYDINANKFNVASNLLVTSASTFGKQEDIYDGVDVSVNTRLGEGMILQGGISTGRERTNNCFTVDSPQATLLTPGAGPVSICDVRPPFQMQAKVLGSYRLPRDFQFAGTFQSSPGALITGTFVARNADVISTLGRNFSSGTNGTANVEIVAPGTLYGPRIYQTDARLTKIFNVGRTRIQANFDLYNIWNANPVLQQNNNYGTNGATWLQPQSVMSARLGKVSLQVNF